MPSHNELERLYKGASDAEVDEARAAGRDAFSTDAWEVISAEVARRRLTSDVETQSPSLVSGATQQVAHDLPLELGPAAQDGRTQISAIVSRSWSFSTRWNS